ncbi:phage tail protein [Aquimarina sp. AD10]|uniref:Glycerol acyltransferase n=1 Tax=Aquimarina aggregata TaxID=1642818 RepID=A0A162WK17_9FLAO|nr:MULTISPECIES: phage tail protein [Aquimarina]AXT61556.1 phage tail protein [Aquimarina sp. AD10]KZS38148.1 glycerol acyltransferase [Aquimarina aggregata]RKM90040.1 phage tail protein [Aquimarina sp. AD10]
MHQIVGFYFRVSFLNLPKGKDVDVQFQSVAGLDVQIEKESLKEGGENRFEHSLPGRRKYTTLTLKRGIISPKESGLTSWCQDAFQNMNIAPISTVNVELLNENQTVLMQWQLAHVWPVSWKVGELNAEKGEVLIETLELNYNYYNLVSVS